MGTDLMATGTEDLAEEAPRARPTAMATATATSARAAPRSEEATPTKADPAMADPTADPRGVEGMAEAQAPERGRAQLRPEAVLETLEVKSAPAVARTTRQTDPSMTKRRRLSTYRS